MSETTGHVTWTYQGEELSTWFKVVGDLRSSAAPLVVLHGGPGMPYIMETHATLHSQYNVQFYNQGTSEYTVRSSSFPFNGARQLIDTFVSADLRRPPHHLFQHLARLGRLPDRLHRRRRPRQDSHRQARYDR